MKTRRWIGSITAVMAVVLLTGCAPGLRASAWSDYQAYLEQPHFKAFFAADPVGPWDNPHGAATGRPSAEEALSWAGRSCWLQVGGDPRRPCRIIALGNRSLVGATRDEIKQAIEDYTSSPDAFD